MHKKSRWQQNKDQLLTALIQAGYITVDGHLTAQWDADQALSQLLAEAMLYRKLLVDVCVEKNTQGMRMVEGKDLVLGGKHTIFQKQDRSADVQALLVQLVSCGDAAPGEGGILELQTGPGAQLKLCDPAQQALVVGVTNVGSYMPWLQAQINDAAAKSQHSLHCIAPDLFEMVLREQPSRYHRSDDNMQTPGLMEQSWLDKLSDINNDSKHVRLTPQAMQRVTALKRGTFSAE